MKDVETFIASGNVIFRSPAKPAALESKIERHLHQALGYEVATFIRSASEVATVAAYRPFTAAALASAGALVVGFLRAPPDAAATRAVLALRTDIDDFHVNGREMYWRCAGGQGDSKLSNTRVRADPQGEGDLPQHQHRDATRGQVPRPPRGMPGRAPPAMR